MSFGSYGCVVPNRKPTTAADLIEAATNLLQSREAVRAQLEADAFQFEQWADGSAEPPWSAFERLVFLVLTEQQKRVAQNRQLLAAGRVRARAKETSSVRQR